MGFLDSIIAPFSSGNEYDAYQAQRQGYNQGQQQYNQYVTQGLDQLKPLYEQGLGYYEGLPQQYQGGNKYIGDLAGRGTGYLDAYNSAIGLNGRQDANQAFRQYKSLPGFDYQLKTSNKALERAGAGTGLLGSGNTMAAIGENSRNIAESHYGSYLDRLQGMATMGYGGLGQAAGLKNAQNQAGAQYGLSLAGAKAGLGTTYGGQIMGAYTGMGNVANQAQTGIGTAQAGYLNSLDQTGANIWGTGLAIAGAAAGMPTTGMGAPTPGNVPIGQPPGYRPPVSTTYGQQFSQFLPKFA
jgi:hypothetical protein